MIGSVPNGRVQRGLDRVGRLTDIMARPDQCQPLLERAAVEAEPAGKVEHDSVGIPALMCRCPPFYFRESNRASGSRIGTAPRYPCPRLP